MEGRKGISNTECRMSKGILAQGGLGEYSIQTRNKEQGILNTEHSMRSVLGAILESKANKETPSLHQRRCDMRIHFAELCVLALEFIPRRAGR
jgi:hypothetical protein